LPEINKGYAEKGGLPVAFRITSFEKHNDGVVSLRTAEMPREASVENTTIYIGGSPQKEPERVDPRQQVIEFPVPSPSLAKGKITVTIQRDSGPETAVSMEDYSAQGGDSGSGSLNPMVRNCAPTTVSPGDTVRLRGDRMHMIDTVFLGMKRIKPTTNSTSASFIVPADMKLGKYKLGYRGPNTGKKMTTFDVYVEAKEKG
jgi:hypothetical protein